MPAQGEKCIIPECFIIYSKCTFCCRAVCAVPDSSPPFFFFPRSFAEKKDRNSRGVQQPPLSSLFKSLPNSQEHQIFLQAREKDWFSDLRTSPLVLLRSVAAMQVAMRELLLFSLLLLLLSSSLLVSLSTLSVSTELLFFALSFRVISHGYTWSSFVFASRHHSTGRAGATINIDTPHPVSSPQHPFPMTCPPLPHVPPPPHYSIPPLVPALTARSCVRPAANVTAPVPSRR